MDACKECNQFLIFCRKDGYFDVESSKYADQAKVFNDLGRSVLDNAWKGSNASLFAYGQTGSGKSYSVFGYGNNKGIVPLFAEALFQDIEKKKGSGATYEMTFSMLEIYNEDARDLLIADGKKSALKIRQHPKRGFYGKHLIYQPKLTLCCCS